MHGPFDSWDMFLSFSLWQGIVFAILVMISPTRSGNLTMRLFIFAFIMGAFWIITIPVQTILLYLASNKGK